MKFRFPILLVLLFAWMNAVHGQASFSTDSLAQRLQLAKDSFESYNYKEAIDINAQIVALATSDSVYRERFEAYNNLGIIYADLKDTLKSRKNYEVALSIAQHYKNDTLVSKAYTNLGNTYSENNQLYLKGIEFYKKSIAINERIANVSGNLAPNLNIGWTYLDQQQPDKALPYLINAKNILLETAENDIRAEVQIRMLLGRYNLIKNNYTLAREHLAYATAQAKEHNFFVEAVDAYKYLAELEKAEGNFEEAFETLKIKQEYETNLFNLSKEDAVQTASVRFELAQYQRDLNEAKREQEYSNNLAEKSNDLATFFVVASIILLIAVTLIFTLFRTRKKYIIRLRENNDQLTQAKERAEKLSKLKAQFFSTVSHEIRTPLYGVIGIASILLEDESIKTHQEDLKSLKFSADYLLALINDVLMVNKMDADGIKLENNPFKLSTLLNSITRSFEFSLEQNKNVLHLSIDERLPDNFVGDSVRLSQILMNLIGNATKFNENGNIWVIIEMIDMEAGGHYQVKFTIKDDGIGIARSKHESIFQEFSQVQNRNYNYQGTGLGLPIVKKLLKLHGSKITLNSELGQGAEFSFILNLNAAKKEIAVDALKRNEVLELTSSSQDNVHILVVDDNRINQKITQKILETRHFHCSLADDGSKAIEMVQVGDYDLILMDINMPVVNGIDATKAIRKFNKEVPIVALTAVEMDSIIENVYEAGMNDVILKPYDVSTFVNIILRNLNSSHTRTVAAS